MGHTLLTVRVFFVILCLGGGFLVSYAVPEWDDYRLLSVVVGGLIGAFVILVDMLLKGFSIRGLTALSFGIGLGAFVAWMLATSPLFEFAGPEQLFLARLTLFVVMMYLGAVIALRGKDDFNLVIPYVRFVPHGVDTPLAVVDTSALIDGRLAGLAESRFFSHALIIPRFVLEELQNVADSPDPARKERGRKGLEVLNRLHEMKHLDIRITDNGIDDSRKVDAKLLFLADQMKAKLLTTDFNLARLAEFQGVEWLNLNALARSLNPEVTTGQHLEVDLVKAGKEPGQAVGYLADGSMVVVNGARDLIGQMIPVEVETILPSAGGKMIFAKAVAAAVSDPADEVPVTS